MDFLFRKFIRGKCRHDLPWRSDTQRNERGFCSKQASANVGLALLPRRSANPYLACMVPLICRCSSTSLSTPTSSL